jgi:probable HAF family extracellular repeat protein
MTSLHITSIRRRGPAAIATALAALAVTTAGAWARPHATDSDQDPKSPIPVFVLDKGRFTAFDAPGATAYFFPSRSNRGEISGSYIERDGTAHGFLRGKRGGFSLIDFPGAGNTSVTDHNDQGQVVGSYCDTSDPCATGTRRAFLRDERGRFTTIRLPGSVDTQAFGINDRGQVVGQYLDGDGGLHGFLWHRGQVHTIDGPSGAVASFTDINDRGDIVGSYFDPTDPGTIDGFLLRRGRYTTFDSSDAPYTSPVDINNRGQIVGFTATEPVITAGELHGFALRRGAKGPFTRIDFPEAPQTLASGINDRGRIVGLYANPNAGPSAQRAARGPLAMVSELLPLSADVEEARMGTALRPAD